MKAFAINNLRSGGIITNYYCTSKCKHCLYGCSPKWEKNYITIEQVRENCKIIRKLGCNSVHIGGGEPFLNIEGLEMVIHEAYQNGVSIEYVETNSSWYQDKETTIDILTLLKKAGLRTILVSISPFHNEFIPLKKVKGVMSACQQTGISIFPWVQDFLHDLDSFDENTTHNIREYIDKFGEDYLKNIPSRYWIQFGGRAIKTFKDIFSKKPLNEVLNSSSACSELKDTSHFHIDLFGNYVPGLCTGISIKGKDLEKPLSLSEYPIINMLSSLGIRALFDFAVNEYDFKANNTYFSKCHLCFEIRKHMAKRKGCNSIELQPNEFYKQV